MTYDLLWYTQNAAVIAVFLEGLKQFAAHDLRDTYPIVQRFYPWLIRGIALLFALFVAFGAKADLLVSIGVTGLHPYVGYAAAGFGLYSGDALLDKVWDNKELIRLIFDTYLRTQDAGTVVNINQEATPYA